MYSDFVLDNACCETARDYIPDHLREKFRPTASIIVIQNGRVLLVQSSKDSTGRTWGLPQGGIKVEQVGSAVLRECNEELGISFDPIEINHLRVLGQRVNRLPPERKFQHEGKDKLLIFVVVSLDRMRRIRLNEENSNFALVADQYCFWNLMGDVQLRRPEKFRMTCAALNEAHRIGMLSWQCSDITEQLRLSA